MMEEQRISFRPSLIIFVGSVGEQIRSQLMPPNLLALLDPPLRQGVGLIQFPAREDGSIQDSDHIPAHSWLARDLFADTAHHGDGRRIDGAFPPDEEAPLRPVLWNMMMKVQSAECIQNIDEAGYQVIDPHTQIYIVGDVESEWMSYVLMVVRQQLRLARFNTEVCYVLSRYEPRIDGLVDWNYRPDWDRRELANFCFIYENAMRPYTSFLSREQSYYAAAEALFALIATGITTRDEYKEVMRLIPNPRRYEQVGNLSSSLIIFPYTEVRSFCSAYLGTELMDEWIDDMASSTTSEQERTRQQRLAREAIDELERWIKDSEIRPGTESLVEKPGARQTKEDEPRPRMRASRWPTLEILRRGDDTLSVRQQQRAGQSPLTQKEREQQEARMQREARVRENRLTMYRRLRDQTRALFEFFSFKDLQREHREHRHRPETWADVAYQRSGRASDIFVNWNNLATAAWWAASESASSAIQRTVDRLWSITSNGLDLARIYIDEYDERLTELANLVSVWRKAHKDNYEATLAEFEQLADGEWVVSQQNPNIIGVNSIAQARPQGANTSTRINPTLRVGVGNPGLAVPGANLTGNQGSQQQSASLHLHLPPREDQIARRLGQRITWEQSRVPSGANLAAAGLLATLALALSVLTLLPALAARPLAILLVFAVIAGLIGLGSWAYHWLHQKNVVKIQKDLLKFYSSYYAHRCEMREDQLRISVISPLRLKVQRMRERLDDMIGFITLVSNGLEQMANEAHDNLLLRERNPAAVRDIYVGNGAILQRTERPVSSPRETPEGIRQRRLERRARRISQDTGRLRRTGRRPTNTLEDLAERIRGKRLGNQRREWWHHPAELKEYLLKTFQDQPRSIIEMSVEETQQYICEFTSSVIDAYLQDPDLVDIGNALDLEETWKQVFDRMERPVYRSQAGNPSAELVLICGYKPKVDRGQKFLGEKQREATRVDTINPDWLLVVGLFRDRSPAFLDVELLFPPKPTSVGTGTP